MMSGALFDEAPRHHDRVRVDPGAIVGNPVVRGTGVPVPTVLDRFAVGLDLEDRIETYPSLTEEGVSTSLRSATVRMDGENIVPAFSPRPRVAARRA